MTRRINIWRLAVLLLLLPIAVVLAAETGPRAPISIEADSAVFDEMKGLSIYTGNVIITQAGLEIRADKVTVFSANQQLQRLAARGEPVHFRQRRAGSEDILGEARELDYDIDSEQLLLQDQAWFTQGKSRFSGQRIEYDLRKKRVTANQAADGSQRVKVTLQPKATSAASDGAETP